MLFLFSFNFRIFLKLIDLIVLILLNMCSINIFPHLILNEIYSEMSLTPPLLNVFCLGFNLFIILFISQENNSRSSYLFIGGTEV